MAIDVSLTLSSIRCIYAIRFVNSAEESYKMTTFKVLIAIFIVTCANATAGHASTSETIAEPHTEAGVLAADDDWLAAELRGDVSALSARLMPTYRDVTLNGKVYTREDLLAHAAKRPDKVSTPAVQAAAEFRATHPV